MMMTYKNFMSFHVSQFASGLSYTTLLSIVPLMGLILFFSLQVEAFATVLTQVREQILLQFLPESRGQVEIYLLQTSQNIKSFSYWGIGIISLSVIWLSIGVERALNHIWQVSEPRKLILRIPAHIVLWILAPLLMTLSVTITSWFSSQNWLASLTELSSTSWLATLTELTDISPTSWLSSFPYLLELTEQSSKLTLALPWLISSSALILLYYFVPNIKVAFKHACISGFIAGFLFEISKWAFSIYITKIAIYEKLYGALASLPVFMLWIFISWVIVLWGACLCATMQSEQGHPS